MRRLKNIKVWWISLVDKGANQKQIVCKCGDGVSALGKEVPLPLPPKTERAGQRRDTVATFHKLQKNEQKHIVYGIVYAPEQEDSQGDIADAETIEKASQEFMKHLNLHHIDRQHNQEFQQAYVVENWIVRQGDELFGEDVGSWAMGIKIEDEFLWERCLSGDITGLSLYGEAITDDFEETHIENVAVPLGAVSAVPKAEMPLLHKIYELLQKVFTHDEKRGGGVLPPPEKIEKQEGNIMDEKTKVEVTELLKSLLSEQVKTPFEELKTELTKQKNEYVEPLETLQKELTQLRTDYAVLKAEIAQSYGQEQDHPLEKMSFI